MAPRDVAGRRRKKLALAPSRRAEGPLAKKGAGKAAQLEQQKAEEERRKREKMRRAAWRPSRRRRGKKSKERPSCRY